MLVTAMADNETPATHSGTNGRSENQGKTAFAAAFALLQALGR
jgi:hypothetical protein